VAAVIGAGGEVGGFTLLAEWRADELAPPKDRDFALGLGPVVVTGDAGATDGFDWPAALELAASGTALYPGDILAAPASDAIVAALGDVVEIAIDWIGSLEQRFGD